MITVLEANLSINPNNNQIMDHQIRAIEVDSWSDYINEFTTGQPKTHLGLFGLHGKTFSEKSRIADLKYDGFRLSCDVWHNSDFLTKKLAYYYDGITIPHANESVDS